MAALSHSSARCGDGRRYKMRFLLRARSVREPTGVAITGRLFDSHAQGYNPFNSQRYTLMAEDAVESAGAKAPAITI
jgi:hypothetical protein